MKENRHRPGCKCAACSARWEITLQAMREFYEIAGLQFVGIMTALEMARLWNDGIFEAFPNKAIGRLREKSERVSELITLILEE